MVNEPKTRTVASLGEGSKFPLKIVAADVPVLGMNSEYEIGWAAPIAGNPEAATVYFAHGATPGVTEEALLAVIIDRLEARQNGPLASDGNAKALADAQTAMESLQQRDAVPAKPATAAKAPSPYPSPYPMTLRGEYGSAVGKPDVTVNSHDEEASARAQGFTLSV